MSNTQRKNPDPDRVRRVQELRRSSAAGPVDRSRDRKNTVRKEMEEQFEDYDYIYGNED